MRSDSSQPSARHLEYLDFELEISPGSGREYPVGVIRSPAGEARATMRFPFDELALENRLQALQIALLRSGGKRRHSLSPEEQTVQDFGQSLFDALLSGEVRSRYDVSQERAAGQGKGLRLKLRIQSPELAALPWEFLYDPRQAEYVCLSRNTPVVRYLELPQPIQPLSVAPPLRILGMIASPRDLDQLDVKREKQRVERAIKDPRASGLVELTWLDGQTWHDLQRAMRGGPWHVLHFIGHGGFSRKANEGFIALADEEGETHHLLATALGRLLADHRSLRLALLNSCEGARGSERDIFSSTAAILVRRGIPAVLAMQYEITDQAAIEFARAFYEALADVYPVDAAVAEARKAVSLAVTNTVEWAAPVLFMRVADGRLFDVAVAAPALPPEKPAPAQPTTPPITPLPSIPRPDLDKLYTDALIAYHHGRWTEAAAGFQAVMKVQTDYEDAAAKFYQAQAQAQKQAQELATLYRRGLKALDDRQWSDAVGCLHQIQGVDPAYREVTKLLTLARAELIKALPPRLSRTADGQEMVLIPAGEFLMGSTDEEVARHRRRSLIWDNEGRDHWCDVEKPQHKVSLRTYYIDRTPITNAQYQKFVAATKRRSPRHWENGKIPTGLENHPVVNVSWLDAVAYGQWLNEQMHLPGSTFQVRRGDRLETINLELETWNIRLPTEAEWEKAARGTDGRHWPWGNEFDPQKCNSAEGKDEADVPEEDEWDKGNTTPVGAYSPAGDSPYGVADMAGNVWEWCQSLFRSYPYRADDGREDVRSSGTRVLRGGSFESRGPSKYTGCTALRCTYRDFSNSDNPGGNTDGFRLVMSPSS